MTDGQPPGDARIDPASDRVTATIRVGEAPAAVALAGGSVWVAGEGGTISRIDAATDRVTATVPVPREPDGLAVAGGRLWVANGTNTTLVAIDPRTARVVGSS